jgi:hypothetical protein
MWQRVRETPPNVAAQVATRIAFLIAGLGTAAWAPLVPYAKQRLGVDDSDCCCSAGVRAPSPRCRLLAC